MKVIFGLGNPEPRYDGSRHNLGFWALDRLSTTADWKLSAKFQAQIAEVNQNGQKLLLVKPMTYYNEVGLAARQILDFYKLESTDFLIIHDDLALDLGTIRVRKQGSDAGNNGVKSLNAHLGEAYWRLRVGVNGPHRQLAGDTAYVLGRFNQDERAHLDKLWPHIKQYCNDFISGQNDSTSMTIEPLT